MNPSACRGAISRRFLELALFVALILVLLSISIPAHAEIPVVHQVFVSFNKINGTMTADINRTLTSERVGTIINVLFTALALSLFLTRFARFALHGFDLMEIVELMLTIFYVYTLLAIYTQIFPAIGSAARYIGDAIGGEVTKSAGANMTMAESIFSQLVQLQLNPKCGDFWDCIGNGFLAILTVVIVDLAIIILGLVATVVEVWTMWVFMIAYAVGWVTIPFLLYERLSFLFDGWMRFYFGAIVYTVVAKTILALVLMSFQIMESGAPGSMSASIDVHTPMDLAGLLMIIFVGIFVLMSTGRFANAIVGGSAGVSGVMRGMAKAASKVAGKK